VKNRKLAGLRGCYIVKNAQHARLRNKTSFGRLLAALLEEQEKKSFFTGA
jgi:hypothetical protein